MKKIKLFAIFVGFAALSAILTVFVMKLSGLIQPVSNIVAGLIGIVLGILCAKTLIRLSNS